MIIHRNELNMKFDLVYWLIRYLKQFNITHGPLFPQMTNDSKLVKSYAYSSLGWQDWAIRNGDRTLNIKHWRQN